MELENRIENEAPADVATKEVGGVLSHPESKKEKSKKKSELLDIIETFLIAAIVFIAVTLGFDKSLIMSGSMEPTLMTGDTVIFSVFHKLDRGDIIEFERDGEVLSKRVIGISGDVITFSEDGMLVRNGEKLTESYVKSQNSTFPALESKYVVPEGKVFVLGDNRLDSFDSRYWEDPYVNVADIMGEYLFTLIHVKK